MMDYWTCPCGAHLDPDEVCECGRTQMEDIGPGRDESEEV